MAQNFGRVDDNKQFRWKYIPVSKIESAFWSSFNLKRKFIWDIPYHPIFELKTVNGTFHYFDLLFVQIELSILRMVFILVSDWNQTFASNENKPEGFPLPNIFFPLISNKLNFFFPCGAATNSAILPSHLPRKSWALSLCDEESLS